MNVNCYIIVFFSLKHLIHIFRSLIWNMLKCNFIFRGMCLSTFSNDAVQILASPELSLVAHRIVKQLGELFQNNKHMS